MIKLVRPGLARSVVHSWMSAEDAGMEAQLLPVLGEYLALCYNTAQTFAGGTRMVEASNPEPFRGKPGM